MRFFNIHSVAKHEKIEENKNFHFREKISQCRKNLKGGTLWDFSTSILSQNIKTNAGEPFGENFFFEKKSLAVPKKMKGSLVSPGMVCYAEKQEKPFWFSSLDQIVHFDAIIFCRTFVELFWSVRVDRKKRVTIIVAFHSMKRRLKMRINCIRQSNSRWSTTKKKRVQLPYSALRRSKRSNFRILPITSYDTK